MLAIAGGLYRESLLTLYSVLGPYYAYGQTALLTGVLHRMLPESTTRIETQLRLAGQALGWRIDAAAAARQVLLHRMLNLADLLLAPRWLHAARLDELGLRLPKPAMRDLLAAQARGQGALLISAYYGPFDLLPIVLGLNGVPAAFVYRRHTDPWFDRLRTRVRGLGHAELIPVEAALQRLPQLLDAGRTVGVVADHFHGGRGIEQTFLGIRTTVPRAIGILAARHRADVVVAGIRRTREPFRFKLEIAPTLFARDYADRPDAVEFVTDFYLRALERIVSVDPLQYNWAARRWGVLD